MTVLNQLEEGLAMRLTLPCQAPPPPISSPRGGLLSWPACRSASAEPLPPPLSPAGVISLGRGLWEWGLNTRVLSGNGCSSTSSDRAEYAALLRCRWAMRVLVLVSRLSAAKHCKLHEQLSFLWFIAYTSY